MNANKAAFEKNVTILVGKGVVQQNMTGKKCNWGSTTNYSE